MRFADLAQREGLSNREREAARLDQVADLPQRVHGARRPHPAAELDAGVLRSGVVGDRDHALRATG